MHVKPASGAKQENVNKDRLLSPEWLEATALPTLPFCPVLKEGNPFVKK